MEELKDILNDIIKKLNTVIGMQLEVLDIIKGKKRELKSIDAITLIEMPPDVRKTMMAMAELEKATAKEVSMVTGRDVSTESFYLDQLCKDGYLIKIGEKDAIYSINDCQCF